MLLRNKNLVPKIPQEAVGQVMINRKMIEGKSNPVASALGSKILTNYVKNSAHIVMKKSLDCTDRPVRASATKLYHELFF
jgi:hypothetical protein